MYPSLTAGHVAMPLPVAVEDITGICTLLASHQPDWIQGRQCAMHREGVELCKHVESAAGTVKVKQPHVKGRHADKVETWNGRSRVTQGRR